MVDCRFSSSLSIWLLTVVSDCSRAPSSVRALPRFCMLVVKRPIGALDARVVAALERRAELDQGVENAGRLLGIDVAAGQRDRLAASHLHRLRLHDAAAVVGRIVARIQRSGEGRVAEGSFCKAAMTLVAVVCGEI